MVPVQAAQPTVHLLCGYAASGKTTLARRISVTTGAVCLTLEEWMLALYDWGPEDPEYGPPLGGPRNSSGP